MHSGRRANPSDVERVAGHQQNGVPVGPARCVRRIERTSECLERDPELGKRVVPVQCCYDNRNRCVAGGRLLCDHKLDANYYEEARGQLWYEPGLCGLSLRCEEMR